MNNRHNQTKSSSGDFCLFYGFPGVAILAISIMVSVKTGAEFDGDGMVKSGTFLGCNALLWLCYHTVFISLPENLFDIIRKPKRMNEMAEDSEVCATADVDVPGLAKPSDQKETEPQTDLLPSEPVIPFDYRRICQDYEQRQAAEKAELVRSIIEYAGRAMSPFVSEDGIDHLCDEIRCWCSNPGHKPSDICLRGRLGTNDLCHFVWNIGERLGRGNGYDGECRASFAKKLFASALSKVDTPSLRNMTKTAPSDRIPLDRPLPGSLKFRYQVTENITGKQPEPV